tara:strand:+ start:1374 stop:1538 length:165 start_codon:yes stop_codon:yes gene_type:complete
MNQIGLEILELNKGGRAYDIKNPLFTEGFLIDSEFFNLFTHTFFSFLLEQFLSF